MNKKLFCFFATACFITCLGILGNASQPANEMEIKLTDTSNIITRIRKWPPDATTSEIATTNYGARVYAYKYINNKVVKYTVSSFSLVYSDGHERTVMKSSGGTNTLNIEMRKFITDLDTASYTHVFLENITIIDSIGKKLLLKGPQKAFAFEDEQ